MNTDPVAGDTAEAALDRLHPDRPGRTPRIGTDADRLTCAAGALQAILRVAPAGIRIAEVVITGEDGVLVLAVADLGHARQLTARLGLPGPRETELDAGWVATRWRGEWADWPVVVQHFAVHAAAPVTVASLPQAVTS